VPVPSIRHPLICQLSFAASIFVQSEAPALRLVPVTLCKIVALGKVRKKFFFEKKNQKTFVFYGVICGSCSPDENPGREMRVFLRLRA
jgi:hypothetical protein